MSTGGISSKPTSSFNRSASQLLQQISTASMDVFSPLHPTTTIEERSFLGGSDDMVLTNDFNSRIRTFGLFKWLGKPSDLTPNYCARYGWVCVEKNLLQCVSCRNYLSSRLTSPADIRLFRQCSEHLRNSVVDAHASTCQWKSNPISEDSLWPDLTDKAAILEEIKSRFNSMKCIDFRPIRLVIPPTDLLQNANNLSLKAVADLLSIPSESPALTLAVCAWRKGDVEETLFCDFCQRTVGLWQFSNDVSSESEFSPVRNARKRRGVSDEKRRLNGLEQHQDWCFWMKEGDMSLLRIGFEEIQSTDTLLRTYPNWLLAIKLITTTTKKAQLTTTSEYVLAKQLLDETMAHIEENENIVSTAKETDD